MSILTASRDAASLAVVPFAAASLGGRIVAEAAVVAVVVAAAEVPHNQTQTQRLRVAQLLSPSTASWFLKDWVHLHQFPERSKSSKLDISSIESIISAVICK